MTALPLALLLLVPPAAAEPPPAPAAPAARPAPAAAPAGAGSAQPAALPEATPRGLQVRVGSASARLGEPFELEIELRHDPAESYLLPAEPAVEPFRAGPGRCRREVARGEATTTCTLPLALFELGPHALPALRLSVATPAGPRQLTVPGPTIEGVGVIDPKAPPDQLQLRPAAPVPLLVRSWRLLWWALGLLAAALLAWWGWRRWRARARRVAEPPPPAPPHERLARRLDALEAERLGEQGRAREHFFRLSEAVREYLGAVTGLPALELTTAELAERLEALGDPRLDVTALRAFGEDADLIKFARFPAGHAECTAGLRFARELLARTRPPPTGEGGTA